MNGRCETCSAEKVCAYQYKPTECTNQQKFEMHQNAVDCPNCNGSGYAYPWKCKPCNGTGLVLRHNAELNGGNMISAYRALPKGLRFFLCYGLMPLWLIPAIVGCALFILVGSLVVEAKSAWENYK